MHIASRARRGALTPVAAQHGTFGAVAAIAAAALGGEQLGVERVCVLADVIRLQPHVRPGTRLRRSFKAKELWGLRLYKYGKQEVDRAVRTIDEDFVCPAKQTWYVQKL